MRKLHRPSESASEFNSSANPRTERYIFFSLTIIGLLFSLFLHGKNQYVQLNNKYLNEIGIISIPIVEIGIISTSNK